MEYHQITPDDNASMDEFTERIWDIIEDLALDKPQMITSMLHIIGLVTSTRENAIIYGSMIEEIWEFYHE